MNYIIGAVTDIGIRKEKNQDSIYSSVINTSKGKMAFSVVCDGLGGLSEGEVASASVVYAFRNWIATRLKQLCKEEVTEEKIKEEWCNLLKWQNERLRKYGLQKGIMLGTTVVATLVTATNYYVIHIGDSRLYEIGKDINQITTDQTLVQRQIEEGKMTIEEAKDSKDKHILLQCCGTMDVMIPEFICGKTKEHTTYILCSDGFYHKISLKEMYDSFASNVCLDEKQISIQSNYLIELNKKRGEEDNMSVAVIKTC